MVSIQGSPGTKVDMDGAEIVFWAEIIQEFEPQEFVVGAVHVVLRVAGAEFARQGHWREIFKKQVSQNKTARLLLSQSVKRRLSPTTDS